MTTIRRGGTEVNAGDVLEVGFWCHFEGIYFTDVDEIVNGHYDYPCGDGDPDSEYFEPHIISAAVVIELVKETP